MSPSCPSCHGGTRDHRETHPICHDDWHDKPRCGTCGSDNPRIAYMPRRLGMTLAQSCRDLFHGNPMFPSRPTPPPPVESEGR